MSRLVTVVTGPIFGLDTHDFLERTRLLGQKVGRKVAVFHLFDEILRKHRPQASHYVEQAFQVGQLVGNYDYYFEELRRSAYLDIARQIDALPADTHAIVRAPATVEWRDINVEFKDHRVVADALQPDRFVTLIDAEWKIKQRLATGSRGAAYRLISEQEGLELPRVLRWLGAEVSRAEDWAEWCREQTGKEVTHHVLGIACPSLVGDRSRFVPDLDGMLKLATSADLPTFYASYSMTVAGQQERRLISKAVARLRRYGLVIDPGSIEIENTTLADEDKAAIFSYTVFRDLRWDVKKVDVVAAFHPYTSRPPLSTGMLDELGHARAYNTDRYLVLPVGGGSPFTAGTYVPKNHVFTHIDAFFEFIEKARRPPIKPNFGDVVDAFIKITKAPRARTAKTGSRPPAKTAKPTSAKSPKRASARSRVSSGDGAKPSGRSALSSGRARAGGKSNGAASDASRKQRG